MKTVGVVIAFAIVAACGGHDSSNDTCLKPDGGSDAGAGGCPSFEKLALDTTYRAEGVGVLDVDKDGHMDIVTDQFWFAGPCFTRHEIRSPVDALDPHQSKFADSFGVYPHDLNGDGWMDIIVSPHPMDPMFWFENPHGTTNHWTQHVITPAGHAGLENPIYEDLFGDGPVLIMADSDEEMTDPTRLTIAWWEVPADPTTPWIPHAISGPGFGGAAQFTHGVGVGDVNNDGKKDVLTGSAWFEQKSKTEAWIPHPFSFGPAGVACGRMWTYDYDGDGLNDVICPRPHDRGIHWWRQRSPEAGSEPTFDDNEFEKDLSQMHALRLYDFDGDKIPEIITGKRWLAHFDGSDPGSNDPALLACYTVHKDAMAGATFTRQVLDDDSGTGGAFAIEDVDGDGKADIVTANKKGVFFFRNTGKP